jgi:hypothetical protein
VSDPQNPNQPTPPPAYRPPAAESPPPAYSAAPGYGQQPYQAAPPPAYGAPATPTIPGRTMGIVAFILSFFVQLAGLIVGIIALVQSRKAGYKNGWALAAIIISSVLLVVSIIVGVFLIIGFGAAAAEYARLCSELGPGTHELSSGANIVCPSTG